jgi:cell division protein DivIC
MRELRKYVTENPTENLQHTIQSDNSKKKHLLRRLLVFFLFSCTVVVGSNITFYQQNASIKEKQKEVEKLSKEMEAMSAEEKGLKDEIKQLNDDEYIAKIARRDYFFSKEGETIFPVAK